MLGPWTCLGTEGILAQGEGYPFPCVRMGRANG